MPAPGRHTTPECPSTRISAPRTAVAEQGAPLICGPLVRILNTQEQHGEGLE